MADRDVWIITYEIKKIDGEPFYKAPVRAKLEEGNERLIIKKGAEEMKDRFDFGSVKITAENVNTGESFTYTCSADSGLQQEWVGGRQ